MLFANDTELKTCQSELVELGATVLSTAFDRLRLTTHFIHNQLFTLCVISSLSKTDLFGREIDLKEIWWAKMPKDLQMNGAIRQAHCELANEDAHSCCLCSDNNNTKCWDCSTKKIKMFV